MIVKYLLFIILSSTLVLAVPVKEIEEKNSARGNIGTKIGVLVKPTGDRWNELRQLSLNVLDNTQNTLTNIKKRSEVALQSAVNKLQAIKEEGLRLIAEGEQTTAEVQAGFLAAYEALRNALAVTNKDIKIVKSNENPKIVKRSLETTGAKETDKSAVVAKN